MGLTVSALITNFNTWSLTLRCINALNEYSEQDLHQIIVVDDGSDEVLTSNLPKNVTVIHHLQNRGYVASVNTGFSHIYDDVVLLLDSDAYPIHNILEPIIQAFTEDPTLGALGFQLVDRRGQPTGAYEQEPNSLGLLLGQALESKLHYYLNNHKSQNICIFSCAIAIRKDAFEAVGKFDEEFDFLDADIDFSIRLHQAGWTLKVNPSLLIFHEGSGSYQETSKRVLRHHKNRWRLLKKHKRINSELLLKLGLKIRHLVEYGILKTLGHYFVKDSAKLADKLYSRKILISQVWSAYGNQSK